MIYNVLYIDPIRSCDDDTLSYDNDTECMVSDVLLEYQECQMECTHDYSSDNDSFEDTIPVDDKHLSSSKYGARGSARQSVLLPLMRNRCCVLVCRCPIHVRVCLH